MNDAQKRTLADEFKTCNSSLTGSPTLANLPELQKHFLNLLAQLGVEGDALAGTFLLMKEDQLGMEEMLLWMYDCRPSKEQIQEELVRRVKSRQQQLG